MMFCGSFVNMILKCTVDSSSLLHNEQARLLREGAHWQHIYIFYICQLSWKKSLAQFDRGKKVELPSLFMENSYSLMHHCNNITDKLSLVKFIICVMSEIHVTDENQTIYHLVRNSNFCIMEASIVFFDFVFSKYGYNILEFSKTLCPFQMVSVVRWHVAGFPIVMQQSRHTQDLCKALRGRIGELYREMWGFQYDFEQIQTGSRENGVMECAACVHAQSGVSVMRTSPTTPHATRPKAATVATRPNPGTIRPCKKQKKMNAYDLCFVDKWDAIWSKIGHVERRHVRDDDGGVFANSRVMCMRHFKTSVVAYAFYRDISKRFPVAMRERNIKRYYHRILCDAGVPQSSSKNTVQSHPDAALCANPPVVMMGLEIRDDIDIGAAHIPRQEEAQSL